MKSLVLCLSLAALATPPALAQKFSNAAVQRENDVIRKETAKCMKKSADEQTAKGVTMAGQVATYVSFACGARYVDFLMSKGALKPKVVREQLLDMGYESMLN